MEKREKIIVILAVIAIVLYGVYLYISSSKKNKSNIKLIENPADNKIMIEAINPELLKGRLSSADFFILENAKKNWRNPMIPLPEPSSKIEKKSKQSEPKYMPEYSGYILMGNKAMAVIDDMEYEIGNILEDGGGYVVIDISPTHVVIRKPGKKSRDIPIVEDED